MLVPYSSASYGNFFARGAVQSVSAAEKARPGRTTTERRVRAHVSVIRMRARFSCSREITLDRRS